jgi:cytochrome c oxidase assembly factor CtaG
LGFVFLSSADCSNAKSFGTFIHGCSFCLAGYLFFWNILGIDPSPRKVPDVLRLGLVFAAAVFHGIFGLLLLVLTLN